MSGLAHDFTLVVPTYNRPAELSRLLAYLARHAVKFPVLILDSSTPATQALNRTASGKSPLNVHFHGFDAQISPWEKFLRGCSMVETECCALCADDDLILPASLPPLVKFILDHPDCSMAHGWYFTFYENVHIGITASVYRGASIDQDSALNRVYALFRNYEALTYGVYRTRILRSVLQAVQGVESMLARELLGGALTVAQGKAARLPLFYYARSHSPSHPYHHWHPLDFLASSPQELYRDYAAYRAILLECLSASEAGRYSTEELATLVDLTHFRYLSDYVKPPVMDYLVEQVKLRTPKPQIMQGVWSVLAKEHESTLASALGGSRLLRRLRDRFLPHIRLHHVKRMLAPNAHKTLQSTTAGGKAREYIFYAEFLGSISGLASPNKEVDAIVTALNQYE